MAVAALSTSAIALATAPASAPAPAAGEASEAFAKLVSRAQPDGQAPQGEAKPETAEGDTETADIATEKDKIAADPDGEAKAAPTDKVDILAELEAIFAAAAQIGVTAPAPVATPTPAVAPTITTSDSAPTGTDTANGPKAATIAPSLTAPVGVTIAAQPAPVETFAAKLADLGTIDPAVTSKQSAFPASPALAASFALPASPTLETPAADGPAATTLRRDIAAIVASLKAAFHPAEAPSYSRGATPIVPVATPSASPVVAPFVQAPPAAAAPVPAAAIPALSMPATNAIAATTANVTVAVTEGEAEAPADEAATANVSPETAYRKAATVVIPKAVPPVSIDHATQAAATKATDITTPSAALSDAPAPSSTGETATIAASAIAPAPLAATPVVPAAIMPTSWSEAPTADIAVSASAAAAPNHAEQSIVRHLDLARDTQWLDQLARDISQSVTQQNHLKFQLNPEHLGALTVEIANSVAGTAIKLTAETDQARAIIADAQPRLLAEVRAQGLRVAESHVDLNQQGSGGSTFAQGQQRQSSEDSKPFVRTQTVNREDAGDSAPREDDELYA